MIERFADCTIKWRDCDVYEFALFSLDGTDNDDVFFCCKSKEEFEKFLADDNGEDFVIVHYEYVENPDDVCKVE